MSEAYRGFYDITEDIIQRLKNAGCSVVTFGDVPEYLNSQKNIVTPGAHVSPSGFSNNETTNTINLEIWVYDLLTLFKKSDGKYQESKYGDQNIIDALDTTMAVIDSFMKKIQSRTVNLNSGGYYKVQNAPQWTAQYEEGNNRVSGWIGTISITMYNYASACGPDDDVIFVPGLAQAPFVRIDGTTPITAPQEGVPGVAPNDFATLSQIPGGTGNTKTIISGGIVYSGTGLAFDASTIVYDFFGTIGTAPAATVTADNGDSEPRFDSFVVDVETNTVTIVKGIPDANPALPVIGESQIFIQAVQIAAGATTPTITEDFAYRDNADWTTSTYTVGSPTPGTVDFESTDNPFQGTFCIQSNTSRSTGIRLQRTGSIDLGTGTGEFSNLSFRIRFDTALPSNRNLLSSVWLSGSTVGNTVNLSLFGVNRNVVGTWQTIVVPTSAFGANEIDRIQIRMDGGTNSQQVEYFLDYIVFSSGILQPSQLDVVTILNNGTVVGTRPKVNFINATTIADDPINDQITVTLATGGGGGGTVDSVVAGTGIAVDDTDPANPVVSSTVTPGGAVDSVTGTADEIVVTGTAADPILSLAAAVLSSLGLADTAVQPAAITNFITEAIVTGTTRQYTKAQNMTNVALSIVSNETAFDTTLSNSYTLDMTANTELQLPTVDVPGSYQIRVYNNGGFTLTFQTGYKVLGDTPSTTDTEYILVNIACFGDNTPWAVVNNQP